MPRWWTESYINSFIGRRYFRRYMEWEDDFQVYLDVSRDMVQPDGSYDEYMKKLGKSGDDEDDD